MLWLRGLCEFTHYCIFTLTFTYKLPHNKHLLPKQVILETAVNSGYKLLELLHGHVHGLLNT